MNVSTKLERIAKLAREAPQMSFTSLSHHIDVEWLKEAYRRTRKDGAVGVDGVVARQYEKELDQNLRSLLDRAKSGTYRAPPVRRVYIPKGNGETRPIGIPTLEDKVLQRAVAMILEAIYEQDFQSCSYGFRRGRSAHEALRDLRAELMPTGGWVLDVDVRKFFDMLDHKHLQAILARRVRDGVLIRLIGKWLNAGVMEEGKVSYPDAGTPQGGVVSPLLANVYLHEVLDTWFERVVKPRLAGRARLIRYADDAVLIFEDERDAQRVMKVLPERLGKYGLKLHEAKTRLVYFRSPYRNSEAPKPGTFDFLGFTHYWARTRTGGWIVLRKTAKGRFSTACKRIWQWCRRERHRPIPEQHRKLVVKLRGHYGYYGIRGNSRGITRFYFETVRAWYFWLTRRSRKTKRTGWFGRLLKRHPLPLAELTSATT